MCGLMLLSNCSSNQLVLVALNITKAFDRLNHFSIFQCLLEHGLASQFVDLFFFVGIDNLHSYVKWEGKESEFF